MVSRLRISLWCATASRVNLADSDSSKSIATTMPAARFKLSMATTSWAAAWSYTRRVLHAKAAVAEVAVEAQAVAEAAGVAAGMVVAAAVAVVDAVVPAAGVAEAVIRISE